MAGVGSPCVKVCTFDHALRICTGCGRTMAEIGGWPHMTEEQRRQVVRNAAGRLKGQGGAGQ